MPVEESCIIDVQVIPRSSRVMIETRGAGQYKIRLTSPPIEGEANKQLIEVLSRMLSISGSRLEIVSGESSRRKRVRISGMDASRAGEILEAAGKR